MTRAALALVAASLALGGTALAGHESSPASTASAFVAAAQQADGGFGERGQQSDPTLTAWAALALVASGAPADPRSRALEYLRAHDPAGSTTDAALAALARTALGDRPDELLPRLRAVGPGSLVNAQAWTLMALRAAGEQAPSALVRSILAAQSRSGGWSWFRGGRPDSNDTAAALEALRSAGIGGAPIRRGLAALRGFQNRDGGFALTAGRESDAQSTAWAIQAILACGRRPGAAAWRYLATLRRPDGSYRYSRRYGTTPVWVTAQVVPALAGKPFPLPIP